MRRLIRAVALVAAALPAVAATAENPVYPVFEGFRPIDDGRLALVFGYYNGHSAQIEIEVGEENRFLSGEGDRGQVSVFRPGRHRVVCILLAPEELEGNLQWALTYNGETHVTTEKGGADGLYLLEDINIASFAVRGMDLGAVPTGRCINRAPSIRVADTLQAKVGKRVSLSARVSDEGLPRDGRLETTWTVVEKAGDVELEDATDPGSEARFDQPGTYSLELRADDGELSSVATATVEVEDACF